MGIDPPRLAAARQLGTTLVEALVAVLVLAFGILAVARVQAHLRLHADVARQRSEAVRLAQRDLETLRAFAVVAASAGARSWDGIASGAAAFDVASGYTANTRFALDRSVALAPGGAAKHTSVNVAWADRTGSDQRVVLDSIVAGSDPAHAAALALAPAGRPVRGALGRSARIPLLARDLGDGRSAFKPMAGSSVAVVLDNASGVVVARCSGVAAAIDTRALSAADLAGCDSRPGLLLGGSVRFALGAAPDPARARDPPLAMAIAIALAGGPYPQAPACSTEAQKTVTAIIAGETRVESVPLDATPAFLGLAAWIDSGDRYVAWHCVVYPRADGTWSGRATLVPSGWTVGTAAADLRVCRYAADLDGSGAVDANLEHPADYVNVDTALAGQNFLVVAGPQPCPAAAAVRIAGTAGDVFVDRSTVAHQP